MIKHRKLNAFVQTTLAVLLSSVLFGQSAASGPEPLRQVHGQTIISNELPAADLTFGKEFRYLGGQRVNLYGMADAEQHLFVKGGVNGVIDAFYWVQFEHRVPGDHHTYNYPPDHTTEIGGLNFIYDVKSWPTYADMQIEDPGSDGAAISRLLAHHHLAFPQQAARVRMFHLPTPDRRVELMIIYGEAIPDGSPIPIGNLGTVLDKDAPDVACLLLDHAKRDLSIQKQ